MSAAPVEKVPETANVNDVTNALSNTSLNDKAAANEAASASAAEGRRLYIGNLAYATTEGELKDFFKDYLVESVSIPKNPRTDRPVGYAFVDLSTPTEAERAIEALSGKEILERKRGPPADGIPSKIKVMVANLPYDLTEEKLIELFKDYQPSSAKIALRPIPRFMIKKLQARGEARKGRGFGFVTLASEELQQKAVAEMNGKEVEGREIAVKVAIDSPDKTDEEANAPADADVNGKEEKKADAPAVAAAPAATEAAPASPATTA
ncbi:unnamed protein product [Clonostachys rosea f. rosea IK726]|uniref:Uncharacterized protein n=1 Tax=Clonostachys rosea f. rosea IK726 TaxID=1349383 RepID=A0ACA9TDP6_BIOOC|nr:unnamed protein product [Clonostachys rosea f. rosea IK726]